MKNNLVLSLEDKDDLHFYLEFPSNDFMVFCGYESVEIQQLSSL